MLWLFKRITVWQKKNPKHPSVFTLLPLVTFWRTRRKKPGLLRLISLLFLWLLLFCHYPQRVFFSAALFFVFKVFIHFDFILHSFLFLIFLPRPLYSCLQLLAMLTQPALRGSELLKPLSPSPPWRCGPQREEWGRWRDQRMSERNGGNGFVRTKVGSV